ncbi:UbiA family prenyltransferase [Streptomyces sp. NPDC087422]|uniref:UbiA family prenyltransferase n=1 Tax=Streptomyces sp. NPDC087422 TaxID=3365786 RepID=UPI00380BBB63
MSRSAVTSQCFRIEPAVLFRYRQVCVAHLQTWRLYTIWYPGLVGLSGACLTGDAAPARLVCAWLGPTAAWIAAHYLGDFLDRELDAHAKPGRPIPSGRIAEQAALASAGLGLLAFSGTAVVLGARELLPAGAIGAGIFLYSGALKARGLAGNLVRGCLTAAAFVFGALAPPGHPDWRLVIPLALAFLSHDTASNLVGTLRDIDGDRSGGYRTFPVRYGAGPALTVAAASYSVALSIGWAVELLARPRHHLLFGSLVAAATVMGALGFWRLHRRRGALDQATALRGHEVLVLERLVLTSAVLAIGIGWWCLPALALLLTLSGLTQQRMRAAYEQTRSARPTQGQHTSP